MAKYIWLEICKQTAEKNLLTLYMFYHSDS